MANINNITTIEELIAVINEYMVTPRSPKLQGDQFNIIFKKLIEFLLIDPTIFAKVTDLLTKADLVGGKVPAAQLPSSVDEIKDGRYISQTVFNDEFGVAFVPAGNIIYADLDTNLQYRWTGTRYIETGSDLALGETSSTAYPGNKGKAAYDHSLEKGNPHETQINDIAGLQAALAAIGSGGRVHSATFQPLGSASIDITDIINDFDVFMFFIDASQITGAGNLSAGIVTSTVPKGKTIFIIRMDDSDNLVTFGYEPDGISAPFLINGEEKQDVFLKKGDSKIYLSKESDAPMGSDWWVVSQTNLSGYIDTGAEPQSKTGALNVGQLQVGGLESNAFTINRIEGAGIRLEGFTVPLMQNLNATTKIYTGRSIGNYPELDFEITISRPEFVGSPVFDINNAVVREYKIKLSSNEYNQITKDKWYELPAVFSTHDNKSWALDFQIVQNGTPMDGVGGSVIGPQFRVRHTKHETTGNQYGLDFRLKTVSRSYVDQDDLTRAKIFVEGSEAGIVDIFPFVPFKEDFIKASPDEPQDDYIFLRHILGDESGYIASMAPGSFRLAKTNGSGYYYETTMSESLLSMIYGNHSVSLFTKAPVEDDGEERARVLFQNITAGNVVAQNIIGLKPDRVGGVYQNYWPKGSGTLALRVNGQVADDNGNIVIPINGSDISTKTFVINKLVPAGTTELTFHWVNDVVVPYAIPEDLSDPDNLRIYKPYRIGVTRQIQVNAFPRIAEEDVPTTWKTLDGVNYKIPIPATTGDTIFNIIITNVMAQGIPN